MKTLLYQSPQVTLVKLVVEQAVLASSVKGFDLDVKDYSTEETIW